jgi:hypothetical protein
MDSLQEIFLRFGKFLGKGGDEFLLPVLSFLLLYPRVHEEEYKEESTERNDFDLSHAIFFGVLIFILVAENYAGTGGIRRI